MVFQDLEGRKGVGDKSGRAGRWEGPGVEIQRGSDLMTALLETLFQIKAASGSQEW